MIVDLVRNDLGRVARIGSVTVPELLAVRPARGSGIWCRRSRPRWLPTTGGRPAGRHLPTGIGHRDAETRARQLLRSGEPHRRGVYCGTVGLASPVVAGWELNVAIRTVEFDAVGGRGSRRGRRYHRRLRP